MNQQQPRIAVLGSINQDLVIRCSRLPLPGETVLAESASEVSGGKGANQAVTAARLGGQVAMIGRVGDDAFSQRLVAGLKKENLDTSHVWATPNCASGIAIVAVEQSGENSILVVPGANGQVTKEDVELAAELIGSCDILLLQLEIDTAAVAAAIHIARARSVRTILNPAPVTGPLSAEFLAVDVICPNALEAAAMLGRSIQTRESAWDAARELARLGPNCAVITLGGEGAVMSDGENTEWFPPFSIAAVDTTAAGDAFAGALAVRLAEGSSLREAVQFASAAGALAATKRGAQPSLPTRAEVAAFMQVNPW